MGRQWNVKTLKHLSFYCCHFAGFSRLSRQQENVVSLSERNSLPSALFVRTAYTIDDKLNTSIFDLIHQIFIRFFSFLFVFHATRPVGKRCQQRLRLVVQCWLFQIRWTVPAQQRCHPTARARTSRFVYMYDITINIIISGFSAPLREPQFWVSFGYSEKKKKKTKETKNLIAWLLWH